MAEQRVISTVDELKSRVGEETSVSGWLEVTQEHVNKFAEATGDHQWIHVHPERATKESLYGGAIAHRYFTLTAGGLFPRNSEGDTVRINLPARLGVNYGLNRVRFRAPVPVGSHVRSRRKLLSVDEVEPGVLQQVWQVTVEVEGGSKPAMVAEQVARAYLER